MSSKSRETFLKQLQDGSYESKQKEVYEHVWEHGPVTLENMRTAMGMAHQTLTSRLSALQDMGVIYQDDETGAFETAPIHQYAQLAQERKQLRYDRWKRRGEDEGFFEMWSSNRAAEIERREAMDFWKSKGY